MGDLQRRTRAFLGRRFCDDNQAAASAYAAGVQAGNEAGDARVAAAYADAAGLAKDESLTIPSNCTCFYGKHKGNSCSVATGRNIAVETSRLIPADAKAALDRMLEETFLRGAAAGQEDSKSLIAGAVETE